MLSESTLSSQGVHFYQKERAVLPVSDREASLVQAAQRGDLSAFNQLVLGCQDDLFGWVISFVQDEDTAEDITQQAFITAYQKINSMRERAFRPWIFRIARNLSIDEIRARRRHPAVSLDSNLQDDEDSDNLLSILPAESETPEEAALQSEQARWLRQLLDKLPDPFRQALVLVELYEMDYQEAAVVLNLPLGTLKSRVSRARLRLRELMEQDMQTR